MSGLGILSNESADKPVEKKLVSIATASAEVVAVMNELEKSFVTLSVAGNSIKILKLAHAEKEPSAYVKESVRLTLESLGATSTDNVDLAIVIDAGENSLEGIGAKVFDLLAKAALKISALFGSRTAKLRGDFDKVQSLRDSVKEMSQLTDAEAGKFEDDDKNEKLGIMKLAKLHSVLPTTFLTKKNELSTTALKDIASDYPKAYESLNKAVISLYMEDTADLALAIEKPSAESLKTSVAKLAAMNTSWNAVIADLKKNRLVDEVSSGNIGLVVADKVLISNNDVFSSAMADLIAEVVKEGFMPPLKLNVKQGVGTILNAKMGKLEGEDTADLEAKIKAYKADLETFAAEKSAAIGQIESVVEKSNKYLLDMLVSVSDQRKGFYEKLAKMPKPKEKKDDDKKDD